MHGHQLANTQLDGTAHMRLKLLCNVLYEKHALLWRCLGGLWMHLTDSVCLLPYLSLLSDVHLHHPAHEGQPADEQQLVRQRCRHSWGAHHHWLWGLL